MKHGTLCGHHFLPAIEKNYEYMENQERTSKTGYVVVSMLFFCKRFSMIFLCCQIKPVATPILPNTFQISTSIKGIVHFEIYF